MDIKDVGKVLRWMGYTASFDVQVMLTREVDVDESGTLDAVELRKLVRRFQEKARSFYSFFGGNSYGILMEFLIVLKKSWRSKEVFIVFHGFREFLRWIQELTAWTLAFQKALMPGERYLEAPVATKILKV